MRFVKDLVVRPRCILVFIAALLLAAPVASASPPSDDAVACHPRSIVGAWTATVYRDDGSVENDAQLWFAADGTLVTRGAIGEGVGTWKPEGGRRFSYTTETNTSFGFLVVSATVTLRGGTFVGEGQGMAYDADGNLLGTGESVIVAVRTRSAQDDR
jgi:hypothetical protein